MRVAALVVIAAGLLSGCAGALGPATPAPSSSPEGSGGAGRVPSVIDSLSPASEALLEQSRRQRRAGEYAQASASVERAIRIEPDHPTVWLELGQLRFEQGDYPQAEQMGRKSLSLAPAGSVAQSQAAQLIADAERAGKRP